MLEHEPCYTCIFFLKKILVVWEDEVFATVNTHVPNIHGSCTVPIWLFSSCVKRGNFWRKNKIITHTSSLSLFLCLWKSRGARPDPASDWDVCGCRRLDREREHSPPHPTFKFHPITCHLLLRGKTASEGGKLCCCCNRLFPVILVPLYITVVREWDCQLKYLIVR